MLVQDGWRLWTTFELPRSKITWLTRTFLLCIGTAPELAGRTSDIDFEGAVLEFACPLIPVDHDARTRHLGVRKTERPRDGNVAKESLAGTNHDRKDRELKLIDEVVLQQRLDQVAAPRDPDLAADFLFEPRDPCRSVAGNQDGIVPLRFVERKYVVSRTLFSLDATGSFGSVTRGQCAAKISYVFRGAADTRSRWLTFRGGARDRSPAGWFAPAIARAL